MGRCRTAANTAKARFGPTLSFDHLDQLEKLAELLHGDGGSHGESIVHAWVAYAVAWPGASGRGTVDQPLPPLQPADAPCRQWQMAAGSL
jgi:hypothetical protein